MHLDWLLSPVTFYSGASICLVVSLTLFVSIKIEMARMRRRVKDAEELPEETGTADDLAVVELKAEVERLRESVCRLEIAPAPHQISASGINLTKRAQILRMHGRGETLTSIAAALETPCNEIALLLKVHAVTNQQEAKAS